MQNPMMNPMMMGMPPMGGHMQMPMMGQPMMNPYMQMNPMMGGMPPQNPQQMMQQQSTPTMPQPSAPTAPTAAAPKEIVVKQNSQDFVKFLDLLAYLKHTKSAGMKQAKARICLTCWEIIVDPEVKAHKLKKHNFSADFQGMEQANRDRFLGLCKEGIKKNSK